MDRKATIDALAKCQHNPIKDVKALELFNDEGLKALEAHCTSQSEAFAALEERATGAEGELKALQEKTGTSEAKIKTLEADLKTARKPLSEEDWMKQAPTSIRSLVERQKQVDEEKKEGLVEALKAAQEVYDEEALKVMSIDDLEKTAKLLKLDEPVQGDFSAGRRIPVQRAAAGKDDPYQNPPDPYAPGVKKLQDSYGRAN